MVVPQPPPVVYTPTPFAPQSKSTYARSETPPPAAAHMVWRASPRRAAVKGGVRTSAVRQDSQDVTHSPMRVAVSGEAEFDARLQKKGELAPGQLPPLMRAAFPSRLRAIRCRVESASVAKIGRSQVT